jgi:hypothetical protein
MTRTRNGKIARLPLVIREKLNQRLRNGEPAQRLVAWLNGIPEVQELIGTEFEGHPLRDQNVSQWKRGGFREWSHRQEALQIVRELGKQTDGPEGERSLTDALTLALAAQYALLAKAQVGRTCPEKDFKLICRMVTDFVALRRCNHQAARLEIARERLDGRRPARPKATATERPAERRNHEKGEIDEKAKASRSASPLSSISPFSWFKSSVPPGSQRRPLAGEFSLNPSQSHLDLPEPGFWPPATAGLRSVVGGFGPNPSALFRWMDGASPQ